jgi:hypothetical protein
MAACYAAPSAALHSREDGYPTDGTEVGATDER